MGGRFLLRVPLSSMSMIPVVFILVTWQGQAGESPFMEKAQYLALHRGASNLQDHSHQLPLIDHLPLGPPSVDVHP